MLYSEIPDNAMHSEISNLFDRGENGKNDPCAELKLFGLVVVAQWLKLCVIDQNVKCSNCNGWLH